MNNIEQIIKERDFLYNLLKNFVENSHLVQQSNNYTTNQPSKSNIYCITVSDKEKNEIEDLKLHLYLNRFPTKTEYKETL
jgi:hypothetical protein